VVTLAGTAVPVGTAAVPVLWAVGTADGYCRVLRVLRVLWITVGTVGTVKLGYCGYCRWVLQGTAERIEC
jgi:hypothetical protein